MFGRTRSTRGGLRRFFRTDGGNIGVLTALMIVPIVAVLGLGIESSSWYLIGRATQDAADSAAVAAANNASTNVKSSYPEYAWDGWSSAAARGYGFADLSASAARRTGACPAPYASLTCYFVTAGNASVGIARGATCPDGTTACYLAVVTKQTPIYLTRIVGFRGDSAYGAGRGTSINNLALAEPVSAISYTTCLTTTGNDSNGRGLDLNGIPFSDMKGCSISSTGPGSPVRCTGGGIGGDPSIFSTSTISSACTNSTRTENRPPGVYVDPYVDYYKKVPCGVNAGDSSPTCTAGTTPPNCSGFNNAALSTGACVYTGTQNLSGTNTLNPTNPSVIYVKNGDLNLNMNATLTSSNVTFVFTGSTPGSITGGKSGAVDITAPTSSTAPWHGVAAYQDTHLATSTYTSSPWAENGGTPDVDIVGLMYMPRMDVAFGGGAGSPTRTTSCYIAIFHSYDANGTGLSMSKSGCAAAGLSDLPTVQILRAALVK